MISDAPVPISYPTLGLNALRQVGMILTYENPLLWSLWRGKKNEQADLEGPYYVYGAPSRQIEAGKAIMASQSVLKQYAPYLMTIRILSSEGNPIQNATLDWWQADSDGKYCFAEYKLRGLAITDSEGYVEILTVPPGYYGPSPSTLRAGHFHAIISPPQETKGKYDSLTTQIYVCVGNNSKDMSTDFLNFVRKSREGNMVQSWSIPDPSSGKRHLDFPELPADDCATRKRVEWWDDKLAEMDDLKVAAGASAEIRLSLKGWL